MKIIEPKVELWQQGDDAKEIDKLNTFMLKIIVVLISLMI